MQEALYINIIYKVSSLLLFYCHVGRPGQKTVSISIPVSRNYSASL